MRWSEWRRREASKARYSANKERMQEQRRDYYARNKEYFSNSLGDPERDYTEAGGIIGLYVKKTGIMPTELDRKIGGFD